MFFASPQPDVKVSFTIFDLWKNEVRLSNSYGASPLDITTAIELLGSERVKVADMITHTFGLSDAGKGFKLVAEAEESMKVIIKPQV